MRTLLSLFAVAALVAGCVEAKNSPPAPAAPTPPPAKAAPEKAASTMVTDPVCKMSIPKGALTAEHENAAYYFCADSCLQKFKAEPQKYAKSCKCSVSMAGCSCGHCSGTKEPCDCH